MGSIVFGRFLDSSTDSVEATPTNALVPEKHDWVEVTSANAAGDPLVVEYRLGGAAGTIVATLTLTYDGAGNFQTVEKT